MRRRYSKSPIVEAVCEFRFEPGDWDNVIPGLIWEQVRSLFPKRRNAVRLDVESVPGVGGFEHKVTQESLTQYLEEDERRFMQVGPKALTVNHLAPYTSWQEFKPLIQQAFHVYSQEAKPKAKTRIGLRYINRIILPDEKIDLADVLEFRPHIGAALPKDHVSFTVGAEFPFEQGRDILRLQAASTVPDHKRRIGILLDLDYFTLLPDSVGSGENADWLEVAHAHIEDAFEGSITDRLRQIFEEVVP